MDDHKEKLLRQYLDDELSDQQEQEALHMIADDAEMRSMLRFEQRVRNSAYRLTEDAASYAVPGGFSQNVMEAIEAKEADSAEAFDWNQIADMLTSLWKPRAIQLRPAYAMVALLFLAILVVFPYVSRIPGTQDQVAEKTSTSETVYQQAKASPQADQVWTRFVYIDKEAESVAVAGDFSNWNPVDLTKKTLNGQQVWTGLIPMQKGEHRYMFVKNGEKWVTDPLATNYEDDGFGNKNAVLYL